MMGWGECPKAVVSGQGTVVRQRRRTGVSALRDLQNYFAVVFAGLEEFVGFFGLVEGEDVADLGS